MRSTYSLECKVLKESTKMLLHYVTGLGIVIAGGVHLFTVFLTGPYLQNLAFSGGAYSVISVYRNIILAVTASRCSAASSILSIFLPVLAT